jgi:hypothetical protein
MGKNDVHGDTRLSALPSCPKYSPYVGGIGFALDNVKDRDIAALFRGCCRDHPVLGLQESSHHIQHSSLADRFRVVDAVACEGCVRGLEKVALGCGDK